MSPYLQCSTCLISAVRLYLLLMDISLQGLWHVTMQLWLMVVWSLHHIQLPFNQISVAMSTSPNSSLKVSKRQRGRRNKGLLSLLRNPYLQIPNRPNDLQGGDCGRSTTGQSTPVPDCGSSSCSINTSGSGGNGDKRQNSDHHQIFLAKEFMMHFWVLVTMQIWPCLMGCLGLGLRDLKQKMDPASALGTLGWAGQQASVT